MFLFFQLDFFSYCSSQCIDVLYFACIIFQVDVYGFGYLQSMLSPRFQPSFSYSFVFVLQWSVLLFWHFKYPTRASTGISFHFRCKILWFSLVDANCFGDLIFLFPTLKPSLCEQLRLRLATLLSFVLDVSLLTFIQSRIWIFFVSCDSFFYAFVFDLFCCVFHLVSEEHSQLSNNSALEI